MRAFKKTLAIVIIGFAAIQIAASVWLGIMADEQFKTRELGMLLIWFSYNSVNLTFAIVNYPKRKIV